MDLPNAFKLDGQTALITGGGTGIGLGIARCMVAAGANVILVGRRKDTLRQASKDLGEKATYAVQDITALDELPGFVESLQKQQGKIDVLVNNAGNHHKKSFLETEDADLKSIFETHINAAFSLSRHIAHSMVKRESGSIIFIASMASFLAFPYISAYTTAKTAVLGMTRALTAELSPKKIRVNAIAPGWIHTAITEKALSDDPERKQKILSRTPMGTFGEPEDIGNAAVYLASPASRFVTGTIIPIDGGASVGF